MRFSLRPKEDWLLLGLTGLLAYVSAAAAREQLWWLLILSLLFLGATLLMLWKQIRARWCVACQLPMQKLEVNPNYTARLRYRCSQCGVINDSGIELNRPE